MFQFLRAVEERLLFFSKKAGINLALGLVAGLLMVAGLGMLAVAAWIALAERFGALGAALGLGCGMLILGVLTLLLGVVRRRVPPPPPPPPAYSSPQTATIAAMIEAFVLGIRSSRKAKPPKFETTRTDDD